MRIQRLGQVLFGLCLGLALVEAGFWWRDDGAFPHVSFYVPDAELGVRLRPHATQRFRLAGNPLSIISVNAEGLRGAELPAAPSTSASNEILVVGDSQVFGLGVNDHETFAHVLSKLTKRPVVNAGVPTYGPLEYNALARSLVIKRKPRVVIYTVNMLNDLFENDRPNTARHRVWDGWAVRAETAPQSTFEFPGRTWLFSQSHAVYALRRYLHDTKREDPSYASEGAWTDLISIGQRRAQTIAQQQADSQRAEAEAVKLDAQLEQATEAVWQSGKLIEEHQLREEISREQNFARAHPGDIVRDGDAESSRSIVITAELIRAAVERRREALAALAVVEQENKRLLASAVKTRDDLKLQRRTLIAKYRVPAQPTSVLSERLRELRALCDQNGCDVLVVALPIDVQVAGEEWAKYGRKPIDMSATTALAQDVLSTAQALGMRTLDALPALSAAEPGAFLDRDIHMTAKGHAALARAIHTVLQTPAPLRMPEPGLPPGRTYPLALEHLHLANDMPIGNGDDTYCTAAVQDEWIIVTCNTEPEYPLVPVLTSARAIAGGHGEVLVVGGPGSQLSVGPSMAHVLAPLLAHEELKVDFEWRRAGAPERERHEKATLIATRAEASDVPVLRFTDRARSALSEELAYRSIANGPNPAVPYIPDASRWPACSPGEVNGNALGSCLPLCKGIGPNRYCDSGICETWQGLGVCRPGP